MEPEVVIVSEFKPEDWKVLLEKEGKPFVDSTNEFSGDPEIHVLYSPGGAVTSIVRFDAVGFLYGVGPIVSTGSVALQLELDREGFMKLVEDGELDAVYAPPTWSDPWMEKLFDPWGTGEERPLDAPLEEKRVFGVTLESFKQYYIKKNGGWREV